MKHELWLSIVVRDRHNRVISRKSQRSKSFLRAWNECVYVLMAAAGINITDTGGVARAIASDGHQFWIRANPTDDTLGIILGTGNTAVDLNDFAVETRIDEGAGGGQMNYLVCTVAVPVVAAPFCSFVVSRSVVNNSGADITVREAGLYMHLDNVGPFYGCGARDVFVPQLVPDGGTITINWTIRVTE